MPPVRQRDTKFMDDAKASAITFRQPVDGRDPGNWPSMIEWLVTQMGKFEGAFRKPLGQVRLRL